MLEESFVSAFLVTFPASTEDFRVGEGVQEAAQMLRLLAFPQGRAVGTAVTGDLGS